MRFGDRCLVLGVDETPSLDLVFAVEPTFAETGACMVLALGFRRGLDESAGSAVGGVDGSGVGEGDGVATTMVGSGRYSTHA